MRLKKTVAAGLAVLMFAGGAYIPEGFNFASVIRAADTDVVVNFKDSADPLTNSIVTGGSVNLDVTKPSGYQESADSANGLRITYGQNYTLLNENGLNVTGDADKVLNIYADSKDASAKPGFFTALNKSITDESKKFGPDRTTWTANINIEGSYDALLTQGSVVEIGKNWYIDETTGELKSSDMGSLQYNFNVSPSLTSFSQSELVLICKTSETATVAPTFTIDGTPTGAFRNMTLPVGVKRRTSDTEDLIITLNSTVADEGSREITLKPDSFYSNDDTGKPFKDYEVAEGETPSQGNRYIQKGTKFTFTLRRPSSNALILTVYSPEAASDQIKQNIESTDGAIDSAYIRLAEGDKLNFIRKNFQVAYNTSRFNTDFYLKWTWEPDYEQIKNLYGDKYPESLLKEAVLFADQPSGFQTVTVKALYDDIPGTLKATIHCRRSDAEPFQDNAGNIIPAEVKITVKGTGQPASLQRMSQWVVKDPEAEIRVVEEQSFGDPVIMPNTIKMNAYDGTVPGTVVPEDPSKYKIRLNMGKDNAASQYAVVECVEGDPSLITMQTQAATGDPGSVNDYQFGGQISNPLASTPATEGNVNLIFTPVKTGNRTAQSIKIKVTFFVLDADGNPVEAIEQPSEFVISVKDDSPSSDATLRTLVVRGKTENSSSILRAFWPEIDIGFDPATTEYSIELPYEYQAIDFTPTRNESHAKEIMGINITGIEAGDEAEYKALIEAWKDNTDENGSYFLTNGRRSPEVPLIENKLVTVEIVVTAEDTTTQSYKLNILRKPKGVDATLKSLTLTDPDGNVLFEGLQKNVFEYTVEIPFKVQRAKIDYEMNDPAATHSPEFNPELFQPTFLSEKVWLDILKGCEEFSPTTRRTMDLQITTYAEDCEFDSEGKYLSGSTSQYTIHIRRADPSEVNTLQSLEVLDAKNEDAVLEYKPAFHKDMEEGDYYDVMVPYSSTRLKIRAVADDSGATVILRGDIRREDDDDGVIDGTDLLGEETENGGKNWVKVTGNTPTKAFTPPFFDDDQQEQTYYSATVEVWPESVLPPTKYERPTSPSDQPEETYSYAEWRQKVVRYPVHIYRAPPSTVNTLDSIVLADQDGNPVPLLDFEPDVFEYRIEVPYEVNRIQVTPTATDINVPRIEVNNRKIDNGTTSPPIKLNDYKDLQGNITDETEIQIVVYPECSLERDKENSKYPEEDFPNGVYKLTIVRGAPSTDCLLIKLEAQNTTDFKPVFAPMRTDYVAQVAEGAEGVILIPTANHSGAKIEIDGKRVESGQPSELIHILTVNQTVKIVVTAQDGETQKTYNVRYTNPNLIIKTSNADLSALDIEPGVRRPIEFDPSVTEYDISVDEETYAVKLFPTLSDSMATMKVYRGSQEIGDEDGNYAAAIQDGANEFSVEVTSPDESKKKTYTVTVYRNDEENMGLLDPLRAEEIDFENSPDVIIVDVEKYPRIARDVFEELKNYPEKKIIFQGNDYSIQFDASDIETIIPNTEYYSFNMSFRSPLEVEIGDEIYSHPGNDDASLVFVYFAHHGQLPGPAVLNISLGSKYRNSTYYWNYYNEERQRVDYYGTVNTNSKGTFSLIIDHLSTYIISDQKLIGANDISSDTAIETLSPYNENDLSADAVDKKLIPNTGVKEAKE